MTLERVRNSSDRIGVEMRITFSLVRLLKAINQYYCQMMRDDELPQLLGYYFYS